MVSSLSWPSLMRTFAQGTSGASASNPPLRQGQGDMVSHLKCALRETGIWFLIFVAVILIFYITIPRLICSSCRWTRFEDTKTTSRFVHLRLTLQSNLRISIFADHGHELSYLIETIAFTFSCYKSAATRGGGGGQSWPSRCINIYLI